ncbi:unnamed protein product [Caenorhabditis sp. 36 PRJEB53466]|nr:unnamed protein product [Caenorhabditis sp. 36 PRJEB53466]
MDPNKAEDSTKRESTNAFPNVKAIAQQFEDFESQISLRSSEGSTARRLRQQLENEDGNANMGESSVSVFVDPQAPTGSFASLPRHLGRNRDNSLGRSSHDELSSSSLTLTENVGEATNAFPSSKNIEIVRSQSNIAKPARSTLVLGNAQIPTSSSNTIGKKIAYTNINGRLVPKLDANLQHVEIEKIVVPISPRSGQSEIRIISNPINLNSGAKKVEQESKEIPDLLLNNSSKPLHPSPVHHHESSATGTSMALQNVAATLTSMVKIQELSSVPLHEELHEELHGTHGLTAAQIRDVQGVLPMELQPSEISSMKLQEEPKLKPKLPQTPDVCAIKNEETPKILPVLLQPPLGFSPVESQEMYGLSAAQPPQVPEIKQELSSVKFRDAAGSSPVNQASRLSMFEFPPPPPDVSLSNVQQPPGLSSVESQEMHGFSAAQPPQVPGVKQLHLSELSSVKFRDAAGSSPVNQASRFSVFEFPPPPPEVSSSKVQQPPGLMSVQLDVNVGAARNKTGSSELANRTQLELMTAVILQNPELFSQAIADVLKKIGTAKADPDTKSSSSVLADPSRLLMADSKEQSDVSEAVLTETSLISKNEEKIDSSFVVKMVPVDHNKLGWVNSRLERDALMPAQVVLFKDKEEEFDSSAKVHGGPSEICGDCVEQDEDGTDGTKKESKQVSKKNKKDKKPSSGANEKTCRTM